MTRNLDELEKIFDLCLEQIQSGQMNIDSALAQYPRQAAELRPRLEAALWLDERKETLDPSPGFIAASRDNLLSQIKREALPNPVAAQASTESLFLQWWRQLVPQGLGAHRKYAFQLAVIFVFLFTTVFGGRQVAYAAQDAIPGDPLYPVKITLERVEMVTTLDLATEIRLHAEFARNRLIEVQELVLEGRYAYIPETLARFGGHVSQAVSKLETLAMRDADEALSMTAYLHESLSDQFIVLETLMGAVPLAMQPEITKALNVTGGAIMVVEEIDIQSGKSSLATPTPLQDAEEDSAFGPQTDTPSATFTSSPSSTNTLAPSETPTVPASATLSAESSTTTPAPAISRTPDSGGGDVDLDPTEPPPPTDEPPPPPTDEPPPPPTDEPPPPPTDEPPPPPTDEPPPPSPTEEPKPTKKPLPSPTRRPPQPTKESKPTQEIEPTQTGN